MLKSGGMGDPERMPFYPAVPPPEGFEHWILQEKKY